MSARFLETPTMLRSDSGSSSTTKASRILRNLAAPLVMLAAAGCTPAQERAPEGQGSALVAMYCADCHAIGLAGASPLAGAPPFRDLHLRYDVEFLSEALVEGMVTAHPEMPEFEFDPDQAAAIVAYLKTLEPGA